MLSHSAMEVWWWQSCAVVAWRSIEWNTNSQSMYFSGFTKIFILWCVVLGFKLETVGFHSLSWLTQSQKVFQYSFCYLSSYFVTNRCVHLLYTPATHAYVILLLFIPSVFSSSRNKQRHKKGILWALELLLITTMFNCPWSIVNRRVT